MNREVPIDCIRSCSLSLCFFLSFDSFFIVCGNHYYLDQDQGFVVTTTIFITIITIKTTPIFTIAIILSFDGFSTSNLATRNLR